MIPGMSNDVKLHGSGAFSANGGLIKLDTGIKWPNWDLNQTTSVYVSLYFQCLNVFNGTVPA